MGAISISENIRIRSEYISVKADALDVANQRQDLLSHFRTLLQLPMDSTLRLQQRLPVFNAEFSVDSLVNRSFLLRPDLKVSRLFQEFQRQNLRLQRSLSVPDVTIGYDYDKGGNYVQQYSGAVLTMPLPVFDRNQGRIKEAKSNIKQSEVQFEYLKIGAANEVVSAYNQYKQNYEGLSGYNNEYLGKLDELNNNTKLFFQKRNISLLEFIDYQRIYTSTKIQLIELRQQYLNSVNQLNFSIGTQLIEY